MTGKKSKKSETHKANGLPWLFSIVQNAWKVVLTILNKVKVIGEFVAIILAIIAFYDYYTFGWDPQSGTLRSIFAPRIETCHLEQGSRPEPQGKNYLYRNYTLVLAAPHLKPLSGARLFQVNVGFSQPNSGHFVKVSPPDNLNPASLSSYRLESNFNSLSFPFRFAANEKIRLSFDLVHSGKIGENECVLSLTSY